MEHEAEGWVLTERHAEDDVEAIAVRDDGLERTDAGLLPRLVRRATQRGRDSVQGVHRDVNTVKDEGYIQFRRARQSPHLVRAASHVLEHSTRNSRVDGIRDTPSTNEVISMCVVRMDVL